MPFLVDTDVLIDFLSGQPEAVATLRDVRRHGLGLSVITLMEVREGLLGERSEAKAVVGFQRFMRRTRVYVVRRQIAERTATIRHELRQHGHPINHRALDLLIAATAIEHGLTLVSRNTRDYADVPGLVLHPTSSPS